MKMNDDALSMNREENIFMLLEIVTILTEDENICKELKVSRGFCVN